MRSNKSNQKAKPFRAERENSQNKKSTRNTSKEGAKDSTVIDGKVISINRFKSQRMLLFKDIVPPRIMTKLKFLANRQLASATPLASIQFNANGIFDFDPAVASNQVAGFDELAFIWGRYRVMAVKAKCQYISTNNTVTNQATLVNLGFEPEFYTANTKNQTNFDGPNQRTSLANPQKIPQLVLERDALSVVGDEIVYTEFGYTGTSASNPASLWYVSVASDGTNYGLAATTTAIRFESEIWVEWFERLDVDSSFTLTLGKSKLERNNEINRQKNAYFMEKALRLAMKTAKSS